jgi:p-hydroxybenzoate 3-monooxygenase
MTRPVVSTQAAIVGGGPAGLMLSHLLSREGVESVVVDHRHRAEIEATIRAGILEAGSVDLLVEHGVSDRVLREGDRHDGVGLRVGGVTHRIDFSETVGSAVWLYPQTEVFKDLADARERVGGDVRFGVSDVAVHESAAEQPAVDVTDADGRPFTLRAQVLIGADGSHSVCRRLIPEERRRQLSRDYPYAWFGIICQAQPSAPELVYAASDAGFALISQRTPTLQRMYFQCDPDEAVEDWSDDRIWHELQTRVAGPDGFTLKEGPIQEKMVLRFRSAVCEPMRHGLVLLAGDAAHTVPPTGAKGLNLALSDVALLSEVLTEALRAGDLSRLDGYSPQALRRVWRAQQFSYWMTTMLHRAPDQSAFDVRRRQAEIESVASSEAGSRYLAEAYTGWPGSP